MAYEKSVPIFLTTRYRLSLFLYVRHYRCWWPHW